MFRTQAALAGILLGSFLMASCNLQDGEEKNVPMGTVGLRIGLAQAASLSKAAATDTGFKLDSIKIILTCAGQSTITQTIAVSGNVADSDVVVPVQYFNLAASNTWKAKILSIDTTLTPVVRDTVHLDSVEFFVTMGDTVVVTPQIGARYAVLKSRALANNPGSLFSGVKYLRLRVGGVMRDSLALGSGLNAVSFPAASTTTGWAVGDYGVIMRTTNAGVNWALQTSGTTKNLNAIYMVSATVGWAVGDSGVILKTSNGTSWTAQTSNTTANLNGVYAASATVGWAVGNAGVIRKTDGTTWTSQTSGTSENLNAVHGVPAITTLAWAVGNAGVIRKTMNGGTAWNAKTSGTAQNLNAIFMTTAVVGWVAGDLGTLRKTRDSSTWTARTSNTTENLNSIYIRTATSYGVVVGSGGKVLKTADSSTWTSQTSNTTQELNSAYWAASNNAWAVGREAPVLRGTGTNVTTWTATSIGSRGFDKTLGYKYLKPGVATTILFQAIDTLSGTLRGYEASYTLTLNPGADTTLTTSLLNACGYANTLACTP